ncbi:MAG: hypothetical protein FWF90_15610 [Promicromonosporaceae bacterium]|nr:hypothetical protein [Promicromonosporaceae bacterium]
MTTHKAWAAGITSGLLAGLGSLSTALGDGRVTAVEWVAVAAAVIVGAAAAGGITWAVPNRPADTP